jgi:hypothetical protein
MGQKFVPEAGRRLRDVGAILENSMFSDGFRKVQFICVCFNGLNNPVRPVVFILQLAAWTIGVSKTSIDPHHVSRLKRWCWDSMVVDVVLLSYLSVAHHASCDIMDSLKSFCHCLHYGFLAIISTDIQLQI